MESQSRRIGKPAEVPSPSSFVEVKTLSLDELDKPGAINPLPINPTPPTTTIFLNHYSSGGRADKMEAN
jgi:hypothetical protein